MVTSALPRIAYLVHTAGAGIPAYYIDGPIPLALLLLDAHIIELKQSKFRRLRLWWGELVYTYVRHLAEY